MEVETVEQAKDLVEHMQSKACLKQCGAISKSDCKKFKYCTCYDNMIKIEE